MLYRIYVDRTEVARFRYISDAASLLASYIGKGHSVQVRVLGKMHSVTDADAFVEQIIDAMILEG
jgi:fructose-1,6-bisphosphatase/inositol monophosphatase family enzyme